MRMIVILASAALTSAALFAGPATADDRLNLTPPLYRDQAVAVQQGRRLATLTTTPQPVPAVDGDLRGAPMTTGSLAQASVKAHR